MADAIRVGLAPDSIDIMRDGDPVDVVITIQNAGTTVDQYAVELDGLPTTWYSLSNSSVALFPQDRDEAKLVLRPPRGNNTKAGTYPFTVTVLSRADPSQTSRVQGTLRVAAVAAFDIDLAPRKVIGRLGRYRLSMRNGGNADLDVALGASDAEEGCGYTFQPPAAHLGPGQQAIVALVVRPKRGQFAGPRKQYDFQVKLSPSQGEPKTLQGQLVYTPRLSSWKPVRRLALLALVVAVLLVALSSQGGIDGVKTKAPQWQKNARQLLCQRLNLLCDPASTTKGGAALGDGGTGAMLLTHPTTTPHPSSPTPVDTATAHPSSPTATALPPTSTPHPPTATPHPPSATPRPPTATPHPATATPPPPTVTPAPPTATSRPPTATSQPPTATPPPPPTATQHSATATPRPKPPSPTPQTVTPVQRAAPVPGARFFSHTHHNLSGPFLSFWQIYGGLDTFGFPRTEPFRENGVVEQYTDRFLLQLVNGQLSTAPLGRILTAGRSFAPVAPFATTAERMYFPTTHHSLSGRFLTYWHRHHGDTLLGAPIAEPDNEQNNDGSGHTYLVQWCENGRMEYHPEFAGTRYEVELGLLGKQDLQRRGWLPPTRPASPVQQPTS